MIRAWQDASPCCVLRTLQERKFPLSTSKNILHAINIVNPLQWFTREAIEQQSYLFKCYLYCKWIDIFITLFVVRQKNVEVWTNEQKIEIPTKGWYVRFNLQLIAHISCFLFFLFFLKNDRCYELLLIEIKHYILFTLHVLSAHIQVNMQRKRKWP